MLASHFWDHCRCLIGAPRVLLCFLSRPFTVVCSHHSYEGCLPLATRSVSQGTLAAGSLHGWAPKPETPRDELMIPAFSLASPPCCAQGEVERIIFQNSDPRLTQAQIWPASASTSLTVPHTNSSSCLLFTSSPLGLKDPSPEVWQGTRHLISASFAPESRAQSSLPITVIKALMQIRL